MKKTPLIIMMLLVLMVLPFVNATIPLCSYESPLGAWDFIDDDSLLDCSGTSYDWENNGCTFTGEGLECIDSEGDYLNQSNTFMQLGTNPFTLCVNYTILANPSPAGNIFTSIFSMRDAGGDDGMEFTVVNLAGAGDIYTQLVNGDGSNSRGNDFTSAVEVKRWQTTCMVTTNSPTNNKKIYHNGSLEQESTNAVTINTPSVDALMIGAQPSGFIVQSNFSIAWVAVWDTNLSAEQIYNISVGNISSPVISIEWDSQEPLNNDFEGVEPLPFNFTLTDSDTNSQCNLYTNDSGVFSVNVSSTGLTNGANTINYNPVSNGEYTIQTYLQCNDTTGTSNTSIKTINIDLVNVLIDINTPSNNSNYNEDTTSINIDVDFINTNLDDLFIEIYDTDDTTLLQSNSSIDTTGGSFTFGDLFTFGNFGTYRITAYGNDSGANFNNKSHYFTLLNNVLSVTLDSPINTTAFLNTTNVTFAYTLVMDNLTSTDCDLLENSIIIDSNFHVAGGLFTFGESFTTPLSVINVYSVNCSSSTFDAISNNVEISIDNEEVFTPNFGFLSMLPFIFFGIITLFIIKTIAGQIKK